LKDQNMDTEKEAILKRSANARRRKSSDPALKLQEYLSGSRSPEEALFKINEILYASQIQSTRKHVRAPITFPVTFHAGNDAAWGTCYTLSRKGMFIKCANPPATGSQIQLELGLPDGGGPIPVKAEVVHSSPLKAAAKNGSLSGMSVVFKRMKQDDRKRIDRLVRATARVLKKRKS